jgi:Cna protein B-type domain./TonB-dependent Receptor Plug Domain.
MARNFRFLTLILSVVLGLSAIAFGQVTTGNVEGTVKDPKGAIVPGVTVTLTGINVGFNRTVQSDNNGTYRFSQVPAGTYNISTAEVSGFAKTNISNITVTIEKTTTADIALNPSGSVNTVEVSADPLGINVDTTDSKVQTNITSALIDQLPKGNNFTSILKVSPGTRQEPLSGGFQVDGASGSENSFIIDGQTLENFRTGTLNANNNIPTSLVQEVQVKTSGFEAEHGGASGGVISVATKSGTDQWRGEFGNNFETSKFQPAPRFIQSSYEEDLGTPEYSYAIRQPKDRFTNFFPTASLGGPIVKGRVWFYGNYSPQIFPLTRTSTFYEAVTEDSFASGTTNQAPPGTAAGVKLVVDPTFPRSTYSSKTTNQYAFGRIDANIFNNLRYSGTYLWNPIVTQGAIPYNIVSFGTPKIPTITGNPLMTLIIRL